MHHRPLSLSLSLCCISLCSSSICLFQPLSPPPKSLTTNAAQLRVSWMLPYPTFPSPPHCTTLFLFFNVLHHHAFWFAMHLLSRCSFPHSTYIGFPLPFPRFTTSLSPSPSVPSTWQHSHGVKTCWHLPVWQVCVCVCGRLISLQGRQL